MKAFLWRSGISQPHFAGRELKKGGKLSLRGEPVPDTVKPELESRISTRKLSGARTETERRSGSFVPLRVNLLTWRRTDRRLSSSRLRFAKTQLLFPPEPSGTPFLPDSPTSGPMKR